MRSFEGHSRCIEDFSHGKVHRPLIKLDTTFPELPAFAWVPLCKAGIGLNIPAHDLATFSGTKRVARSDRRKPVDFFTGWRADDFIPCAFGRYRGTWTIHIVGGSIGACEVPNRPRSPFSPCIVISGCLVDRTDELFGREICETLETLERQRAAFAQKICGELPVDRPGDCKVVQGFASL